jgi:hypothetical protein
VGVIAVAIVGRSKKPALIADTIVLFAGSTPVIETKAEEPA